MTPVIETSSSYRASGFSSMSVAWTTQRYVERPSVPSPMQRWEETTLARLAQLERLTPNWDAFGAHPVTRTHSTRAAKFLRAVMAADSPRPDIVPLADGGVQLEWYLPWGRFDYITDTDSEQPVILRQLTGEEATETSWDPQDENLVSAIQEILKGNSPG